MKKLLKKEMMLTASPLSYIFIAFAFMTLIPSYPVLIGAFFVCFGIFHTFRQAREAGDVFYTAMLPVAKCDVVSARYAFIITVQGIAFVLSVLLTVLRMTVLSQVAPYAQNELLNPNPAFLGGLLVIYALFNTVFVCSFYKTAYHLTVPFFAYGLCAFIVIGIAEALHFVPGIEWIGASVFDARQLIVMFGGIAAYIACTVVGIKISKKRFERIDL